MNKVVLEQHRTGITTSFKLLAWLSKRNGLSTLFPYLILVYLFWLDYLWRLSCVNLDARFQREKDDLMIINRIIAHVRQMSLLLGQLFFYRLPNSSWKFLQGFFMKTFHWCLSFAKAMIPPFISHRINSKKDHLVNFDKFLLSFLKYIWNWTLH